MTVQIFDRQGREVIERPMLWADRLAIALFLLTGGLLGTVYLVWGDPGTFRTCEEVSAGLVAAIWFAARTLDFLFTGRIR